MINIVFRVVFLSFGGETGVKCRGQFLKTAEQKTTWNVALLETRNVLKNENNWSTLVEVIAKNRYPAIWPGPY